MVQSVVTRALEAFAENLVAVVPRVLTGLLFLVTAAIGVKAVLTIVGYVVERAIPGESAVYRRFLTTLVAAVLWFGVLLSFLSIVGLTVIAASLGTATGFLALGVSFALSDMIADAVAGVYLLRDPDFQPGDTVTVDDVTGEVVAIELRKTRLLVEGDTVVRANADIETEWRKGGSPAP